MTTPATEPSEGTIAPKSVSRWEDFIDIFHSPTAVYERRENQSPWPTVWIITIVLLIVTVVAFNSISPVYESEIRAKYATMMAKTPQLTQDAVERGVKFGLIGKRWGAILFPLGVLIGAIFVWIAARLVGVKETYGKALVVVTYASIISIVQSIVEVIQGLVMNVTAMTSVGQLSLSPVRFMDKASTSPVLYTILQQFDVFAIWTVVLMAIGVRVTGKTTRGKAIAFAVLWWVVKAAVMLVAALKSS
jgi:hypothetical protein